MCQKFVIWFFDILHPLTFGFVKNWCQAVRHCFVRSENSEVAIFGVKLDYAFEVFAKNGHVLSDSLSVLCIFQSKFSEVRQDKIADQFAGVRVRVGRHALVSFWSDFGKFRLQFAAFVK